MTTDIFTCFKKSQGLILQGLIFRGFIIGRKFMLHSRGSKLMLDSRGLTFWSSISEEAYILDHTVLVLWQVTTQHIKFYLVHFLQVLIHLSQDMNFTHPDCHFRQYTLYIQPIQTDGGIVALIQVVQRQVSGRAQSVPKPFLYQFLKVVQYKLSITTKVTMIN